VTLFDKNGIDLSVRQWANGAADRLTAVTSHSEQEVRWMLQSVLDVDTTGLWLSYDDDLTVQQHQVLERYLSLRLSGKPLAYVLEQWSFYGLALKVTTDTLVPRADTEILVEQILDRFPVASLPFRMLDLGTGTGAIALAVADQRPQAKVIAIDRSIPAIQVAAENAKRLGVSTVSMMVGNWCEALTHEKSFDIIASNPPYLSEADPHLEGSIRFEPRCALVSGLNGLEDFQEIIHQSWDRLKEAGMLILEHGFEQGESVRQLLETEGYEQIRTICDLNNLERVSIGIKPL